MLPGAASEGAPEARRSAQSSFWQVDREDTSLARLTLNVDFAPVQLNNMLNDGESKTCTTDGTTSCLVGPVETLEKPG